MAQSTETIPDLYVDDLYFSAISNEENDQQTVHQEENFQVLDSKYAEELQFQEALMASIIASQMENYSIPSSQMTIQASMKPRPAQPLVITATNPGESSLSFCEICVERKESDLMFKFETCVHSYCFECITKHVATKIGDGVKTVTCPGVNCKSVLWIDSCREVLPKEVLRIWEEVVCVDMIDESQKFYCPYKDCSGMLVDESGGGGEVIVEAECPFCHRLFCARCHVPWHSGVGCEEFQRLNEDERAREDIMVMEIAKQKKWGRCPQCKFYVERTEGCPHITCRCKFEFCYGCGSGWTSTHAGCQRE